MGPHKLHAGQNKALVHIVLHTVGARLAANIATMSHEHAVDAAGIAARARAEYATHQAAGWVGSTFERFPHNLLTLDRSPITARPFTALSAFLGSPRLVAIN